MIYRIVFTLAVLALVAVGIKIAHDLPPQDLQTPAEAAPQKPGGEELKGFKIP